jgi:hypothetical protein
MSLWRSLGDRVTGCATRCEVHRMHVGESRPVEVSQWPKGADLAPDALYEAVRENGFWFCINPVLAVSLRLVPLGRFQPYSSNPL